MCGIRQVDFTKQLICKMVPPLVTFLSAPLEVQWVALCSVNLKQANLLLNEMRVFFCKHNNLLYIKAKKLAIMIWLMSGNIDALLSELKGSIVVFWIKNSILK